MNLVFLGSGEAFDEEMPNISMVLSSKTNLLIDCGYNVPQRFWKKFPDIEFLDAIFISHFHADHVAGVPILIMRMRQEGRKKPLVILGPSGFGRQFKDFYELMYRGFYARSGFEIKIQEVKEGNSVKLPGIKLSFVKAKHLEDTDMFVPTLALRADLDDGSSFCYSSDTVYNESLIGMARGADLLIYDSYMPASSGYHKKMSAHSSPRDAGITARKAGVRKLALFNVHRSYRDKHDELIKEAGKEFAGDIIIPREGQILEL